MHKLISPLVRFAARSYIVGDRTGDALHFAHAIASEGWTATIGYWDARSDSADQILERHRSVLRGVADSGLDTQLSVKLPPLDTVADGVAGMVEEARGQETRVLFDSHAPEASDQIFEAIDRLGPEGLGLAVPGRWRRSLDDAGRAIELGLRVRVVKGQWPDPGDPDRDLRAGTLQVIDRLAGRASFVAVASHDPAVVRPALERLRDAGTDTELELLFPLPVEPARTIARELSVPTRLYIPYGWAWLPYSLSRAGKNPRMLLWLLRDLFRGRRLKVPRGSGPDT